MYLSRPPAAAAGVSPESGPQLPRPLALPFSLLPAPLYSRLVATVLNSALAGQIAEGELDFLRQRTLVIRVRDAGIAVRLTLTGGGLVPAPSAAAVDLGIEASVYDFLVLLGQQEDPDTLVFQRRLLMQGDTELGLEVKNFLDGVDVESLGLYRQLAPLLHRLLPVYCRLFS